MAQSQDPGQPQSRSRPISYLVLIVAIGILWVIGTFIWGLLWVLKPALPEAQRHRGVGERFTGLDLKPLTGDLSPLSSADVHGRVVLLSFWGPWCPPCRKELPKVAELAKRLADRKDFVLAAISYPPGGQLGDVKLLREDTTELLKRLDLDLPTYVDSENATLTAADQIIGFQGFPSTLLLDRQGVIRAVWVGYMPGVETEIEQQIDKLLEQPVE
jgi:cytochrome c biogenesis protein CcmG, thiol:disulfide interchange protein DsbE